MRIRLRDEKLREALASSGRSHNAWALALGLDSGTFVGVAAGLTLVALAASYLPARRAARVDPVDALHHE